MRVRHDKCADCGKRPTAPDRTMCHKCQIKALRKRFQ